MRLLITELRRTLGISFAPGRSKGGGAMDNDDVLTSSGAAQDVLHRHGKNGR